jgi:RNA polymerase sigma factor (sigma-70 family)
MRSREDWNELLARCLQTRDRAAWREMVAATYAVIAAALSTWGDAETVKDLTQGFYLKLLENDCGALRAYDPSRSPLPVYLRTVATRHAIDQGRKRGRRQAAREIDLESVAATLGIDPDAEDRVRSRRLHEAIEKLTPQQRLATRLLLEGTTVQEIARCMGLEDGGAAALLWRARNRLREILGPDG